MWGALIGAGASLLGGVLNKRSDASAQRRTDKYNDPQAVRERAEKAGFNPLTYLNSGASQRQVVSGSHAFGNALANAGLQVANGMSEKKQLDLERTKLQQDRQRLDKLIERETIRPKVGGIYSGNISTPIAPNSPRVGAGVAAQTTGPTLGAPSKGAPPVIFNPSTPYQPNGPGTLETPTTVLRSDGMTSADPESPPEFEADFWAWAREGTMLTNTWELYQRNTMSLEQRARVQRAKKAAAEQAKRLAAPFTDERKKGAKLPKISFPNNLPSISN